MEKSALTANRTVALDGFDFGGRPNRKSYPAAMAPAGEFDKAVMKLSQKSLTN